MFIRPFSISLFYFCVILIHACAFEATHEHEESSIKSQSSPKPDLYLLLDQAHKLGNKISYEEMERTLVENKKRQGFCGIGGPKKKYAALGWVKVGSENMTIAVANHAGRKLSTLPAVSIPPFEKGNFLIKQQTQVEGRAYWLQVSKHIADVLFNNDMQDKLHLFRKKPSKSVRYSRSPSAYRGFLPPYTISILNTLHARHARARGNYACEQRIPEMYSMYGKSRALLAASARREAEPIAYPIACYVELPASANELSLLPSTTIRMREEIEEVEILLAFTRKTPYTWGDRRLAIYILETEMKDGSVMGPGSVLHRVNEKGRLIGVAGKRVIEFAPNQKQIKGRIDIHRERNDGHEGLGFLSRSLDFTLVHE